MGTRPIENTVMAPHDERREGAGLRSGSDSRPGQRKLRQIMEDIFKARLITRDDSVCRGIIGNPEEIHLA